MHRFLPLLLFFMPFGLRAQTDSLTNEVGEDLLENFLQEQEEDTEFDYNDLFDDLDYLRRRPLDLNRATDADLDVFLFLNELQKNALLRYREEVGDLISIYELQAIPEFDLVTIKRMLPFVKVNEPGLLGFSKDYYIDEGKSEVLLRWSRILEDQKGYSVPDEATTSSRYLGSPDRLYLRYRYRLRNRISIGVTAEKDGGETFFRGSNKQGFDFYSAHLFFRDVNKHIKAIALGDFSVAMGQGLIIYQGFATRKSVFATTIKRSGRTLRQYSSVNEFDFFRGAGATFAFGKNWEFTAFGSHRARDANLDAVAIDTLESPDELGAQFATSLQISGLHRTQAEIDDENAIRQTSAGGVLKYSQRRWHIALNGLYEHLDKPLQRSPALYNQFYFNGTNLANLSADYAFTFRNYHFFGETALSDNGALATLNGLLIGLDRRVDLALFYRNFPRDYQSLNPKPLAETTGARNEQGFYVGISMEPARQWRLNGYFDLWKHPWLRFGVDAPSNGYEWLVRLTFVQRKKMEAYVQVKHEVKEENSNVETGKTDPLVNRAITQARIHLSYKLSKTLEWRSRFDFGYYEKDGEKLKGISLFQDIIYKPLGFPVSFSTRFAIFDTDGYAIRFYSYENDVLNQFSVPAYYDRGNRFYLTAKYRINRNLTLEGRYARTVYPNVESIGTGLDEIRGDTRSEVKAQLRLSF
ncbi:MAG: helix-hairpin-helix domain-containing protein [Saprospiraceae bacterium]